VDRQEAGRQEAGRQAVGRQEDRQEEDRLARRATRMKGFEYLQGGMESDAAHLLVVRGVQFG